MDTHYRAVVVDDERLARVKLILLLAKYDTIEIVGEAEDVSSAITIINKVKPDLLFLDIQMPKQTGFNLLDQVDFHGKVVFVTAYDEYAVRAFEVNALDYLMKPVSTERIEMLLKKLEKPCEPTTCENKLDYDDKIFVPADKFMKFINVKDIIMIQSIGNYTRITSTGNEHFLIYKSLKEWLARLPNKKFCQVHRSILINIDHVSRIEKWFNYTYHIMMNDIDQPIKIGKMFSGLLKERFG